MSWPHERAFRGRAVIFSGLTLFALLRARSLPGVSDRDVVVGALAAAVVSLLLYAYTWALGALDARFRHVHPRKFRVSNLVGFYLFAGLGFGLLVAGPWLVASSRSETPTEMMAIYLVVPCLLSAAAGIYRVLDQHRAPRPPWSRSPRSSP